MFLLILAAAQAADCTTLTGVVLNELSYESGSEWIELYNPSGVDVDVGDVVVEWGTSSWSERTTLPTGTTVPARGYYVVGVISSANLVLSSFDLGNATSHADGIRLVCDSTPFEIVLYGADNSDGAFADEVDDPAVSLAPELRAGQSLARVPEGVDTDRSGDDFMVCDTPSPGTLTSCTRGSTGTDSGDTGVPVTCAALQDVVINEFNYNSPYDWVELYNRSATAWVLDGWVVEFGTSDFDDQIELVGEIAPGGFFVVGEEPSGTQVVSMDLGNASNSDGLRLRCGDTTLDTVIYGEPNENGWLDERGDIAAEFAPVNNGGSIQRFPDGADTDHFAADFFACDDQTPGASNGCVPPDCSALGDIKLNEFTYATDEEWVELYNAGGTVADLSNWHLEKASSDWEFSAGLTLPEGLMIGPGEFLVLGRNGAMAAGVPVPLDVTWEDGAFDPGNASSTPDAVRLACQGATSDVIIYGNTDDLVDDPWVEEDGTPVEYLPGKLSDGEFYEREDDGADTNRMGVDWLICDDPSPGESNRCTAPPPPVCEPWTDQNVVINELLYDNDGSDTDEWVEIFNAGSSPVTLEGWRLQLTSTTNWNDEVVFDFSAEIPAGGYLVVGNGTSSTYYGDFALGNASSSADGIRLVDCDDGTVVDTVVYGDDPGEGFDELGWESPGIPLAEEPDQSLARIPNGTDTNDQEDWEVDGSPTPGAENNVDGGGGDSGTSDSGDDTGKDVPCTGCACDCERPDALDGADYTRTMAPLLGLTGLAVLVRRRSRRQRG